MSAAQDRRYVLVTADVRAILSRLARDSQSPRQDFLAFGSAGRCVRDFFRLAQQVFLLDLVKIFQRERGGFDVENEFGHGARCLDRPVLAAEGKARQFFCDGISRIQRTSNTEHRMREMERGGDKEARMGNLHYRPSLSSWP